MTRRVSTKSGRTRAVTAGDSTLRIAPPLVITRDLVDQALDILIESIHDEESGKPL